MAASTGPDQNTYQIDDVELGDTFNVWRDTTNTQTYKLNKMRIYSGISSDTIDIGISLSGVMTADIRTDVNKGLTFLQPVNFSSGVTFNGPVTFNANTFTVNASIVTIDDYAIVLGDTAGGTDALINAEGGGGLLLRRSGGTAEWRWRADQVQGSTGIWYSNAHIGLSGATNGIYPSGGKTLPVHGTGLWLNGGVTTAHGIVFALTDTFGSTSDRTVEFSRTSPAGSTAFIEVLSGSTYGTRPFVSIRDGANRKTVTTASSHGFQFGMPVRFDGTNYVKAQASDGDSSEVVGVVSRVISTVQFELTFIGEIFGSFAAVNGGPLNPGSTYYLSPYVAGEITAVQPTASGVVHKAVLVATSATSAIVLPFTGGVLSSPISIVNASSVSTTIPQYNKFTLGDMVRFKQYAGGITLNYKNGPGAGASANQFNAYGIFVKAQANTEEDAEVAGMVVGQSGLTGTAPDTFYTSFDVLMDGFFDLSTSALSLTPGSVYFLNTSCAGTSASFESPTVSHNTAFPTQFGQVRKPLFMATGPKSGYLFSYRGDIRAEVGVTGASADITRFLVNDIRDGFSGDLVVGVYNAANNGRESLRVAAGTAFFTNTRGSTGGVIGIGGGWTQYTAAGSGSRIMAQLDVNGELRLGRTAAAAATPLGQDIIVLRHDTDAQNGLTMSSRLVIGTDHTDASAVIGHKVRPNRSGAGYLSSLNGTHDRAALVIGASGGTPALRWRTATNSNADLGVAVALTDVFNIVGVTAQFLGTHFNIGAATGKLSVGSSSVSASANTPHTLNVMFDKNNSASTDLRFEPGVRIFNGSGAVGEFTTLAFGTNGSYSGWAGKRIGANQVDLQFFSEAYRFANGSSNTANDPPMYINGSNGRIGIGTNSPAVALDVNGIIQAGTGSAVGGSVILVGGNQTGSYSYPQVLNLIGSEYSSGGTLLTYGLRPKTTGYGFESTHSASSISRAALRVGTSARESSSSTSGMVLYADKSGTYQGSIGDNMDSRLKPIFRCDTSGMYYKGASTFIDGHITGETTSNVPLYIRYKGSGIAGTFVTFQAATTTSTETYTDSEYNSGGNNVGSIVCNALGVVTYNTFCGTHWSYNTDEKTEILPGTVMETISEQHGNHLPKCKICRTANAPSVYGVYSGPSELNTETPDPRKVSVASLGAFFVRIASGSEVSLGDLLVCGENGCAVSQGDDIVRSCTIGKVTSTVKLKEYADGSYTVPAVLYCG